MLENDMSELALQSYRYTPEELIMVWKDGKTSRLDAFWLRDHCQMPECRDPVSGQRLFDVSELPAAVSIAAAERIDNRRISITFSPETHESIFHLGWLRRNCYCVNEVTDDRSESSKTLWSRATFPESLPRVDHGSFVGDGKLQALQDFSDFGFVLLFDVPCQPGKVLDVIGEFGFVRETNYGRLFEVRTEIDPNNLAYSNLGLGFHTDNPYRDPVPTVQLLHCLASSTTGGDSVLLDGFSAAAALREEHPDSFQTLTSDWIEYSFSDAIADLNARVPMIETNDRGEVIRVRYNNRSIATLRLPAAKIGGYYQAYRRFAAILRRPSLQIQFKLSPGDLVLFDNTRVMHGRTAFTAEGNRHLQGAYADLDGVYSTLNLLRRSQQS